MDELSLYTEPVSGFRSWRVTSEGYLTGVMYRHPAWQPPSELGDRRAQCKPPQPLGGKAPADQKPEHPIPNPSCACGYYALDTYDQVQRSRHVWGSPELSVRGVVIGWGRVVIGEKGWRAEYARPVALLHWPERRAQIGGPFNPALQVDADRLNKLVKRVADRYHAAYVDTVEELQAIAAASGAKPAIDEPPTEPTDYRLPFLPK